MVQAAQSSSANVGTQVVSVAASDGLLPITGDAPRSVYVKIDPDTMEVLFSLNNSTWHPGGISWQCDEYALYITYILTTPDIELKPSRNYRHPLWFSPVLQASTDQPYPTQLGCAPPIVDTYHFRVHIDSLTNGGRGVDIDPKIVVTPE